MKIVNCSLLIIIQTTIASKYAHFSSPPMGPSDFDAKPMVLIMGQYSVGKTSFIRSLIQQDFPGQRIGPEPTTDRFTAIMHANPQSQDQQQYMNDYVQGRLVPGHALVMQGDKPFQVLFLLRKYHIYLYILGLRYLCLV